MHLTISRTSSKGATPQALCEGLKIYETNTGIFYSAREVFNKADSQQEYRSLSTYWQIVYGKQGDPGSTVTSIGPQIASAGSIPITASSNNTIPRRVQRVYRRIEENVRQAENGGYTDPRIRAWLNVKDQPNIQRERWQKSLLDVLVMQGGTYEGEDALVGSDENPLKPGTAHMIAEVALLDKAVDAGKIGMVIESAPPINLAISNGVRTTPENIKLPAMTFRKINIELKGDSMVNLWVDADKALIRSESQPVDIALSLNGANLANDYTSDKQIPFKGESISSVLPAGKYTLTISDRTDYEKYLLDTSNIRNLIADVEVGINIKPYTTQKIEGRISIPESGKTFDVSMSRAEFDLREDGNWVRKDSNETKSLNPSLPVWVPIHGMNSNENYDTIENLARTITEYGMQVVTVNWSDAAKDPLLPLGEDAPWTPAVGKWVARQLIAAGFKPGLINGAGHSHGTYVLYYMGQEILELEKEQMNALVALDPAGNVSIFSEFSHKDINFSIVARNSIAFESSLMADSDFLANTAHTSIRVNSPYLSPKKEHQLGLTTFTEILRHEHNTPGSFSDFVSMQKLMTPWREGLEYAQRVYEGNRDTHIGGEFDFEIDTWVSEVDGREGKYYQGHPSILRYVKPDEGEQDVYFDVFA